MEAPPVCRQEKITVNSVLQDILRSSQILVLILFIFTDCGMHLQIGTVNKCLCKKQCHLTLTSFVALLLRYCGNFLLRYACISFEFGILPQWNIAHCVQY